MKITCNQKDLYKAVSIAMKGISTRSTIPALSNILFEAKDGNLKLSSTNLEVAFNCWIPAEMDGESAISIPARLLAQFLQTLPDEKIRIEIYELHQSLSIQCARTHAKFNGLSSEDFPRVRTALQLLAEEEKYIFLQIDAQTIRTVIEHVAFSASTDMARPALTGVEFKIHNNQLQMSATDGYRLSIHSITISDFEFDGELSLVIPASSFRELSRIIGDYDGKLNIYLSEKNKNSIIFRLEYKNYSSVESIEFTSQIIDAKFPNYSAIIPTSHLIQTAVPTKIFSNAIKIASIFTKDSSNIVGIEFDWSENKNSKIRVLTPSSDYGDTSSEISGITINSTNENAEQKTLYISFNGQYLIDMLNSMSEDIVYIEAKEKNRPIVMKPQNYPDSQFMYVVMPMQRQS